MPPAVNARVSPALKKRPTLVSPVFVILGSLAEPSGKETTPVNVGLAVFALVATAVAILSNSVFISVPLTILFAFPEGKASLVAKLVVLV